MCGNRLEPRVPQPLAAASAPVPEEDTLRRPGAPSKGARSRPGLGRPPGPHCLSSIATRRRRGPRAQLSVGVRSGSRSRGQTGAAGRWRPDCPARAPGAGNGGGMPEKRLTAGRCGGGDHTPASGRDFSPGRPPSIPSKTWLHCSLSAFYCAFHPLPLPSAPDDPRLHCLIGTVFFGLASFSVLQLE